MNVLFKEPLNMYHFVVDNDDTNHYIVDHLRPLAETKCVNSLFLFSRTERSHFMSF